MNPLTRWYPGDRVVVTGLEMLTMIAILILFAWIAETLLARRRAALRCAFWTATLLAVVLTPLWTVLGQQMPWRIALSSQENAPPIPVSVSSDARRPEPDSAVASGQNERLSPAAGRMAIPSQMVPSVQGTSPPQPRSKAERIVVAAAPAAAAGNPPHLSAMLFFTV